MASIGLKHFVFAKGTYTDGSAPTYTNGKVVGKAIEANITLNRSGATLYADDVLVESDNAVTGGTIAGNVDDLDLEEEALMFGVSKVGSGEEYEMTDVESPYGGCGYVVTKMEGGTRKYIGYWIYKAQFGMTEYNASTKGDGTEFATPRFEGQMHGISNDNSGVMKFFVRQSFTSVSAAIAWVDGKAGISA